ncbi:LysR family transcriptional regulator [Citrobacter freundii]|jgi:DNA-binding transcriptional LysR family regulator|uniref:LysR family transcriptional regulator SrsR n=1 Tax=Citrobacter europaeus TaxID=1914243 RepID=UPI000947789E|nr:MULTISPECIES: LysR family transcriptional regulator [Citrobacter]APR32032.1 LysR family transcriptional regulator [Citrobacter freundii]MBJ8823970.1 LysR family transcriptional regulator [Citrobacter freundii]MBJ9268460.1 LysR family transcriptional regulator [Citrobacter freundii]MBY1059129.1 LysR family transcriptional regulator [Citrobacter europaeus]MDT7087477.1 LysR family transcriptional regulator [Citrobacter europaeus]
MDIFISKKMRNFILLAQTNNIARAAEKIHMTASPFGKSIAALEDQIGYTLFTRKDNNISLNKAGQELYQKLFPVYQRLSAIDNEIHNASRRSREIVIGIDNTYPTIIFDQLISLGDKYHGVTAQAVEFSENGVIDNLFDRKLDFIISPQHVSPRVQELENLAIDELPPLRLGFLVSRRYEEKQPQDLLRELPWLQMRFQNRANFEAMLDAYMRPCGINPTIIYRPYSFMAKISAVERGQFLTVIPHFAWRLVNPSTLKYFDAPGSPMYMQEFLYSLKNHRYTATMLEHIAEDRDGTAS